MSAKHYTTGDAHNRTADIPVKQPRKLNFFRKFGELQVLMLQHNAGLTASHPYASTPINWPFLLTGISFWTQTEGQKQIYLIGNLVGWWTCVFALSVYVGILGADLIARRRATYPIPESEFPACSCCLWPYALFQLSAIGFGTRQASSYSSGRSITSRSI